MVPIQYCPGRRDWFWWALLCCLVLTACAGQPAADIQGDWTLVSLNSNTPLAEPRITIGFADGEFGGTGGCNQYGGRYILAGERLRLEDLAQTEMACLDPAITQQEAVYMAAVLKAEQATVAGDRLTMTGFGVELVYQRDTD